MIQETFLGILPLPRVKLFTLGFYSIKYSVSIVKMLSCHKKAFLDITGNSGLNYISLCQIYLAYNGFSIHDYLIVSYL